MFYQTTKVADIKTDLAWRKSEIVRLEERIASGKARNAQSTLETIKNHKAEIISLEREISRL